MIKYSIMALLVLVSSLGARAQDQKDLDTVKLGSLPDTVQQVIRARASDLLNRDTVSGRLDYKRSGYKRSYTYKLFISGGHFSGIYTFHKDCTNCGFNSGEGYLSANMLYCCKDPKHSPNETAATKAEMEAIQKQKHCSKIGICIID